MPCDTIIHDGDTAKRTPGRLARRDGAEFRERGHRRHRRRCRRNIVEAQHAIIDRLIAVGETWAPDYDDLLPPAPSGSRTYVGTAFGDLRRSGIIRTVGGPVSTTFGGRHSPYLHRWTLAVDHAAARRYQATHPIPDADPTDGDLDDLTSS